MPYLKVKKILCSHRSGFAQLARSAKYPHKEAMSTLTFPKGSEEVWSIYNGVRGPLVKIGASLVAQQ